MDFKKIAKKAAIEQVVKTLVVKKKKAWGNKLPQNTFKSAVEGLKELGIDIKVAALYKRVQRASTSPASNSNNINSVPQPVGGGAKSQSTTSSATSSIPNTTHAVTRTAGIQKKSTAPNAVRKTHAVRKEDRERYKECMNEITKVCAEELASEDPLNMSASAVIRKIMDEKKVEFNLTEYEFSVNTIKSRLKRHQKDPSKHKLESFHPGHSSPLAQVELAIVEIVLERANIGEPMERVEIIQAMNDKIKGTQYMDELRRVKTSSLAPSIEEEEVGSGWYKNFLKRNEKVLGNAVKGRRMRMYKKSTQASNSNNINSLPQPVGEGAKSPSTSASATSSISNTIHVTNPNIKSPASKSPNHKTAGIQKKSTAPNAVRKTHAVRKEDRERYKECMNEITKVCAEELASEDPLNMSASAVIRKIMDEKKVEFNLTEYEFSVNTIKSRLKRHQKDPSKHKLESFHPGHSSPLAQVELAIVEIVLERANIGEPMERVEIIQAMNDKIKGTQYMDELRRVKTSSLAPSIEEEEVGSGWYKNFLKRNEKVLGNAVKGRRGTYTKSTQAHAI